MVDMWCKFHLQSEWLHSKVHFLPSIGRKYWMIYEKIQNQTKRDKESKKMQRERALWLDFCDACEHMVMHSCMHQNHHKNNPITIRRQAVVSPIPNTKFKFIDQLQNHAKRYEKFKLKAYREKKNNWIFVMHVRHKKSNSQ